MGKIYEFFENSKIFQCIKQGLVFVIPVLFVGAFALVFKSLPIDAYQRFITGFASGLFYQFFNAVFNATFGLLGIYMTIGLSISFLNYGMIRDTHDYTVIFTSIVVFMLFSGAGDFENINMSNFGAQGICTALISTILTCYLYNFITGLDRRKDKYVASAEGMDAIFQHTLFSIPVMILIVGFFAIVLTSLFDTVGVNSFQELIGIGIEKVFGGMGRSLSSALIFIFMQTFLWFFGVHGSNVMEPVSQKVFQPGIEINQMLIEQGQAPTEIFSKQFFDVFVVMGGCGGTICLLLAVLIFGKNRGNRKLAKMATVPMLFNINEMLVFGLPIVFNPTYFIPFILTPIAMTLTSAAAFSLGIVPLAVNTVEWTTPVIIGGYIATGSVAGAILQVVNICIGVAIYAPFVKYADKLSHSHAKNNIVGLTRIVAQSEETRKPVELLLLRGELGIVARRLAEELSYNMSQKLPLMYYQPQYDNHGKCIGVEALLRWKHPLYDSIYPPLILKLADEMGMLVKMEELVFKAVIADMDRLINIIGEDAKVSVNATGEVIQMDEFEKFLVKIHHDYPQYCKHILIEITEQAYLQIDENLIDRLKRIHELGFRLGIDDFSMGSTSIKYLQYNVFDLIKLDGSISREITSNARSREIIIFISKLAQEFHINILAEYVETEEQRKMLEEAGCCQYQGYLYSPAVPIETLEEQLLS